ncbi:MAG: hypothetical protein NVSMB14_08000 [Isosphaeraceae bacterium]
MRKTRAIFLLSLMLVARSIENDQPATLFSEDWNYVDAMTRVAHRFEGREGMVLHVGDSITVAPEYGAWALRGAGKTLEDRAILSWMRAGTRDETDGWFLAAGDDSMVGPSHTACGGIRTDEMLRGGKLNLPSLAEIVDRYRPQIVILMLGTNDIYARRDLKEYCVDIKTCAETILERGAVCVLSTIPPYPTRLEDSKAFNASLRSIARELKLPLIDFEREILARRPTDWNGTLLNADDVHPSASRAGVSPESEPSARNLRESGYLLRGWLSVRKISEGRKQVLDRRHAQGRRKNNRLVGMVESDQGEATGTNRRRFQTGAEARGETNIDGKRS